MSIREKDLSALSEPVRFEAVEATELDSLRAAIQERASYYGAAVAFMDERLLRGAFDRDPQPCLSIYHPDHESDYYQFCITRKLQGKTCVLQTFTYGKSRQMKKEEFAQNTKVLDGRGTRGVVAGGLFGGAFGTGMAIGSATAGIVKGSAKLLAKGFNALTMDKAALAEEKDWYGIIISVLQELLS